MEVLRDGLRAGVNMDVLRGTIWAHYLEWHQALMHDGKAFHNGKVNAHKQGAHTLKDIDDYERS
jgi:hypothetical protein